MNLEINIFIKQSSNHFQSIYHYFMYIFQYIYV